MNYLGLDKQYLDDHKAICTAREISQQPELWLQTVKVLQHALPDISDFVHRIRSRRDLRIVLTGAGSSAFAGEMVMPFLIRNLKRPVASIATTDITACPEHYLISGIPTVLISFARSGNSPESVAAVEIANNLISNLMEIVITCNPDGKLAKHCQRSSEKLLLLMPEKANDEGFAMTGSYSCMALSAAAVFFPEKLDQLCRDVKILSETTDRFIAQNLSLIRNIASGDFDRYICLGSGSLRGMARESALKMLELTGGAVSTGYDTPLGFRHGPKSVINEKTLTLIFVSSDPYTRKYDLDLIKELSSQKKENLLAVAGCDLEDEILRYADFSFDFLIPESEFRNDLLLPLAGIIPSQVLAFFKSLSLGLTPDNPCPTGEVNRVVKGVRIYKYNCQEK